MFWPGISDDITNAVKACDICQKHKPAQQKEPLMPHDVPSMPWVKLGIDLFEHRSHHYLLVADYFSKFPIVKKLSNRTSGHVIGLLKTILHPRSSEHLLLSTGSRCSTQALGTPSKMVSFKPWSKRLRTSWKRQKSPVLIHILQC